jgi:pseudouridine-5'-phosphate glycosidase
VSYVHVHPEVRAALDAGRAVVALESTIVAHGMPYPANLETARAVEDVVRAAGAVPATVAVLGGRLTVGLEPAELEHLARAKDVLKLSRRDLGYALSQRRDGATTVAATMVGASRVGIRVFVTGGIGGVHREGESTLDVSADLGELSRTPVAVVCAGAKAILDLGRTLEVLETLGVPVVGFGTDAFPAFYSRDSGHPVPLRLDSPQQVAALLAAHWGLGLQTGVVVAVPIPAASALPGDEVEAAVRQALAEATRAGVRGKALTPHLLAALERLTGGRSLAANRALVLENARVGAGVAVAHAALV